MTSSEDARVVQPSISVPSGSSISAFTESGESADWELAGEGMVKFSIGPSQTIFLVAALPDYALVVRGMTTDEGGSVEAAMIDLNDSEQIRALEEGFQPPLQVMRAIKAQAN